MRCCGENKIKKSASACRPIQWMPDQRFNGQAQSDDYAKIVQCVSITAECMPVQ